MSFEDPFANDSSSFRYAAAGLQQTSSPATGSNLSYGLGGGATSTTPLVASPNTNGQLGATSTALGTGSLLPGSGTSGVSIFPSAANPAPVAGRRARGTPSASSPLSATPSSVSPSLHNTTSPSLFPQQQREQAPQVSAAPSALPWLDNIEDASLLGKRRQDPPLLSAPDTVLLPGAIGLSAASAGARTVPVSGSVPPFLNFDNADGTGSTSPPPVLLPSQGAAVHSAASPQSSAANDHTAAELEKKKRELRDLYATLDALDMEQQRLEERLDTRQLKEETDLLALETTVMEKTNELSEKEEELISKRAESAGHTTERLEALSSRYAREMNAQLAEVRSLDGARFEKQLQQVRTQCTAVEDAVKDLRERAALALVMEPFSEKGVRVALATATSAVTTFASSSGHNVVTSDDVAAAEGDGGSVAPAFKAGLQKAVDLLRAYCDQRLGHTRERLVDYVHTETLEAAHAVRRRREQSWADDAVQHKTLFSQYMMDMMQRYMVFYRERTLLKQKNIATLQDVLRNTATELRERGAARLQELLKAVTAKMSLSMEHQARVAEEAKNRIQKKCSAVLEGDVAMAAAQREEMESRLLAEAQARRQRFQVEEQSLLDQLQRLRRSNETAARDSFQCLRNSAETSGPTQMRALDEEVAALKARVQEKLYEDTLSLSSPSARLGLRAASSAAHMHADELAHVIGRTLADAIAQQQSINRSRRLCDDLRSELLLKMQEAVAERLRDARCVQHAHQSRIDAQRKVWEAAHRQNLTAACSLILPISGSTSGTADAQYVVETYAAPQDITSIAVLDVIRDKLQSRDAARRQLLQTRKECLTRCLRLLGDLKREQETVHTTWEGLWRAAETHLAQQTTSHEVQLEVEKNFVAVTAQRQTVRRDWRNAERECRRIAEAVQRLKAEAALDVIDSRLLCAPPELMDAEDARLPVVHSSTKAPTTILHTVDPSVINRLPSANKLTAAHNTASSATATNKPETLASTTILPLSAPTAAAGSSTRSPVLRDRGDEKKTTFAATSSPTQRQGNSPNLMDISNATTTPPWSSALLRAEQLLSPSNVEDGHTAAGTPFPATAPAEERPGRGGTGSSSGDDRCASDEARKVTLTTHSGSSRSNLTTRGVSYTSANTTVEERHRSSSSLHSADVAPQLGSPTSWLDTDTGLQLRQQKRFQETSLFPWQLQRPQGRTTSLFETWSTLEEFRSGADHCASVHCEQDVPGDGTAISFDDSANFVDLLSCTDSPASS